MIERLRTRHRFYLVFAFLFLAATGGRAQTSTGKPVPTVQFCDLVRNPDRYDQVVVRVSAILTGGPESSTLYDPTCNDQKSLTWFEWDAYSRALQSANKEVRTKLSNYVKLKNRARILTIGKFESKHHDVKVPTNVDPEKTDVIRRVNESMGFGHLGSYHFQFVPTQIEKVDVVPDSVPLP